MPSRRYPAAASMTGIWYTGLLRLTLVKKNTDIPVFDQTFARYFKEKNDLPMDLLHHLHEAILTIEGDSPPGTNPAPYQP